MKTTLLSIGVLAALLIAGCSEKAKEDMSAAGDSASNAASHTGAAVSDDTKAASDAVKDAGAKTVEATKDAGNAVAAGAEKAGATVVNGAKAAGDAVATGAEKAGATVVAGAEEAGTAVSKAGKAMADSTMTPKVKVALHNVAGLDVSKVDVDTVGKTVMLKGSVPDAASKKKAEEAAKLAAGSEYKVVDSLTVGS